MVIDGLWTILTHVKELYCDVSLWISLIGCFNFSNIFDKDCVLHALIFNQINGKQPLLESPRESHMD